MHTCNQVRSRALAPELLAQIHKKGKRNVARLLYEDGESGKVHMEKEKVTLSL